MKGGEAGGRGPAGLLRRALVLATDSCCKRIVSTLQFHKIQSRAQAAAPRSDQERQGPQTASPRPTGAQAHAWDKL